MSGQASDIEIHAREMINTKKRLTEIYSTHTGKNHDALTKYMDRDYFFSAEEAKDFGLVDEVVKFRKRSAAK